MRRRWLRIISFSVRATLLALVSTILIYADASAQADTDTTFTVTVEEKSSAHPESDRGWGEGFVIDGQQGKSVTLVRGHTYAFQLSDVASLHTFYISTSDVGLGADPYDEGVTGNFATGNEVVTIEVGAATPDLLYYQCGTHEYMGWRIYVMDEVSFDLGIVAEGLTSPVTLVQPDDGSGRLFIVDQAGKIRIVTSDGALVEEPFLDVTDRMVSINADYDERGLLGIALHPDFETNGRFFVYYSAPLRDGAPGAWNHTATISEFTVAASDPNVADPESERIVLQVDKPQDNHNGGTLLFGPEGYLFISLGDGGGADDTNLGHVADWYDANDGGNGQDVEQNLLGNILRIDVDVEEPYGIPESNPFVGSDGMDEIYAYGFRNPYRMSMDSGGELGLLVGDSGQARWEEVSQVTPGGNYGWNVKEGTHCFNAANHDQDAEACPDVVGAGHPDEGDPLVDPVIEFANASSEGGLAAVVVGGIVYRGSAIPELDGKYVFGAWSAGFSEPEGRLFVATPVDEGRWPFQIVEIADREGGELREYVLGIAQDNSGEAYILTTEMTGPTGQTGTVYRVSSTQIVAREDGAELPDRITLQQNFPNPFNPSTTIQFTLPTAQRVTLAVFDLLGREVATLVDAAMPAGAHSVTWNARNGAGTSVPSGSYIYRLRSDTGTVSKLMTLIK